jgi:hypothetical protein
MMIRKGFGRGYILPDKQRINRDEIFKCKICNAEIKRYSIYSHLKSKIHNQSVIDRHNPKYWTKKYCFNL